MTKVKVKYRGKQTPSTIPGSKFTIKPSGTAYVVDENGNLTSVVKEYDAIYVEEELETEKK